MDIKILKKYSILITFLIVFSLVLYFAFYRGDEGKKAEEADFDISEIGLTGYKQKEYVPVWKFPRSLDYEPWEDEPYINPMGSESGYSEIEIISLEEISLNYIDMDSYIRNTNVNGKIWNMKVPYDEGFTEKENQQFNTDLRIYLETKGGEYLGYYDDRIYMVMKDEEQNHWWLVSEDEGNYFQLQIIKEKELKPGQEIVIKPKNFDYYQTYFSSYNGKYFQSVAVEFDRNNVYLDIYNDNFIADYKRNYHYSKKMYDYKGTRYVLDDALAGPGRNYWKISWDDDNPPQEISIKLENLKKVDPLVDGEELGGLQIESERISSVNIYPVGGADLNHPEFDYNSFRMDRTPEGDYLAIVPSGYYNVEFNPSNDILISNYKTVMVPVNSGEITRVEIPLNISQSLSPPESTSGEDKGIVISNIREKNNKVDLDFSLVDSETEDILPSLENTTVYEGNKSTSISTIERVKTPPSIVLVMDSSGSMKGVMDQALNSAKGFVNNLPANAEITIIDFDTKVKKFKGKSKEEALSNLDQITQGGSTALYDALYEAVKELEKEERPTIVAFTDGEDGIHSPEYSGSATTKAEIINTVKESNIPLYTIGFREGHDGTTLKELAEVSKGKYYSAGDKNALDYVFNAVKDKLASTFTLTYERPKESSPSDIPVVQLVLDISGSMDSDTDETCGYRMDDIKNLYHDFIMGLPEETQVSLLDFDGEVRASQVMTTDKTRVLRALGELKTGYFTDIAGSVYAGYQSIKPVASTKKVMIYLTDAALGVESDEKEEFDETLNNLKEDKINVLWVGLGKVDEQDFKYAAEKSGGKYVIVKEPGELKESYESILKEVVDTPESKQTNITINIEKYSPLGEVTTYSQSRLAELSPVEKSQEVESVQTVRYIYGSKLERFNRPAAELLSGDSIPGEETIIEKRIKLSSSGENEAALIDTEEIIYMNKLKGVEPPSNKRFLAVVMNIQNIIEKQEVVVYPDGSGHPASWVGGGAEGEVVEKKIPYMIPNFSSHFYLGYNNEATYPAASATWLAEDPVAIPGDYSITLDPGEEEKGVMIFLVPEQEMQQSSLHFYDTNYGHIDIPLVGKMEKRYFKVEQLLKEPPEKISDIFSLEITGNEDCKNIQEIVEAEDETLFRVVEGNFISDIQALIDVDPAERFLLKMPTGSGDFYIPLNEVTTTVPSGFYKSRKLSPGSFNLARWVFQIPDSLKDNACQLFIDLKGKDKTVKIKDGERLGALQKNTYETEFADITINNFQRYPGYIKGIGSNKVVLDFTVKDKKDGFGSTGIPDIFLLENLDYKGENDAEFEYDYTESGGLGSFASMGKYSERYKKPESYSEDHILGFSGDTVVYDGTSRRGFLIFDPEGKYNWVLKSPYIEDLEEEIQAGNYPYNIFGQKNYYSSDSIYERDIKEALSKRIEKYRRANPEKVESYSTASSDLNQSEAKKEIYNPMVSYYGELKFSKINNIGDLYKIFSDIKYIPSNSWENPFKYSTSKEAMISQGYGSAGDMANYFIKGLAKLGYKSKRKVVTLTDKGKEILEEYSGIKNIEIDYLPAVVYKDEGGTKHTIVLPFMREINEIHGLVYIGKEQDIDHSSKEAKVKIYFEGMSIEREQNEQAAEISDALAGGGGESLARKTVFSEWIPLDELSLDAADITISKKGYKYGANLLTAGNKYPTYEMIDSRKFETYNIIIEVEVKGEEILTHKTSIGKDMNLEDVFHTISINAPDLKEKALDVLEEKGKEVHENAENPDELSALRWYSRSIINKFNGGYSLYENESAEKLDLIIGRRDSTKVLLLSVKAGSNLETSINLMKTSNQVHEGEEESVKAFNIMTGLYASRLESEVLPGQGYGFWEIWEKRPENSSLILLDRYSSEKRKLEEQGYNPYIQERFNKTTNYVLVQDKPSIINGEKRWAWLEINPKTYETIALIDTGEKGSFVEQSVMESAKNAAYFALGAFKGVETSIWSVSGFSLKLGNYKKIKKAAKDFALGLSNNFSVEDGAFSMGVGGTPEISKTIGPVSVSFDGSAGVSEDLLGFTNGYKAGIEYYFNNVD